MRGSKFLTVSIMSVGAIVALFVLALGADAARPAQPAKARVTHGPTAVANSLLVKVKSSEAASVRAGKSNTGLQKVDELLHTKEIKEIQRLARVGSKAKQDSALFRWYRVELPGAARTLKASSKADGTWSVEIKSAGRQLEKVAAKLRSDPHIEVVEPNYIVTTQAAPNDPYYASSGSWGQSYGDMWGLSSIGMETAWDQVTNAGGVLVADIDTGVDRNHPDLVGNMWVNTAEVPNNGIDDDANGYVDDYHGWDWKNNDNDPMDDHGHGTHTVGTIAATGNNGIGVTGVAWSGQVMALKFLGADGGGTMDASVGALQYAADMGAKISSNSWGCSYCFSKVVDDAVNYQHDRGMVVVAAAGNSNANSLYFSPASSQRAVTVAASDAAGAKASFSNWGAKIDVSAPGVDILSTRASVNPMCTPERTVGQEYCRVSGTSMATPHVAGVAALMLSKEPNLTNEQVRTQLRQYAIDAGQPGVDESFGHGIADAGRTLTSVNSLATTALITSPHNYADITTSADVIGTAAGPRFQSYRLEFGEGMVPTTWITAIESTVPVVNGVLGRLPEGALVENSHYSVRLVVTDVDGVTHTSSIHELVANEIVATITWPEELIEYDVLDLLGSVEVAPNDALDHYTIEWAKENDVYGDTTPLVWSSENLILTGGGRQEVSDDVLATWDNTSYPGNRSYYFRLTVYTASGKTDTFERGYFKQIPDREPPTVSFVKPTHQMKVGRTLDVEINAEDNFGSPRVELLLDGVVIANYDYYPYGGKFDTSAYANGEHELVAIAYDRAGYSSVSEPVTFIVDNTAPVLAITKPTDGATIGRYVDVEAIATDNDAITKVEFFNDRSMVGLDTEAPYTATWDTNWAVGNTLVLTARAYDVVGNMTEMSVTVHRDIIAPTVSIVSPTQNASVEGTVNIVATAEDAGGMRDVKFYVDNKLVATDVSVPYGHDWDTRNLADGTGHTLMVVATDIYGRSSNTSVQVKVHDVTAPNVWIVSPTDGATVARNATVNITASASDASSITKVEFYVDGVLRCTDLYSAYACPWQTPRRRDTPARIYVKAYDSAGNVKSSNTITVTTL